jgi:hypothetical protein
MWGWIRSRARQTMFRITYGGKGAGIATSCVGWRGR